MVRNRTIGAVLVVFAVALVCMPGCQQKQETPATEQQPVTETEAPATEQVALTCPVCGASVATPGEFTAEYEGKTYDFCCAECRDKFTAAPTTYVTPPAAEGETATQ